DMTLQDALLPDLSGGVGISPGQIREHAHPHPGRADPLTVFVADVHRAITPGVSSFSPSRQGRTPASSIFSQRVFQVFHSCRPGTVNTCEGGSALASRRCVAAKRSCSPKASRMRGGASGVEVLPCTHSQFFTKNASNGLASPGGPGDQRSSSPPLSSYSPTAGGPTNGATPHKSTR